MRGGGAMIAPGVIGWLALIVVLLALPPPTSV
jgi:hypothetical protein